MRNVIYDRDPTPPVLNMALHRPDMTYDRHDFASNFADLDTDRSVEALAGLPLVAWARTYSLREYGNVGLFLFLYVPFGIIAAAMVFGVRSAAHRGVVVLSLTAAYAVVYCILTSHFCATCW